MKKRLLFIILSAAVVLSLPHISFGQAPSLGTAASFELFSTDGAVTNTGTSQITGNVGTNNGSSTGFGNVNGGMHDGDGTSAQCAADLLIAYNQLNSDIPTSFPAPLLGNGQVLTAGVYAISSAATLNADLILNAQGNAGAVFIFQIHGSFSAHAASKVKLTNGALACNVFWKVEGLVSLATGTSMKGTIIANNAAITLNILDTLEGRALSTTGAVTVNGILAYTPIGCGSPVLTGPAAPALASTECYAIFSSDGAVSNSGITHVTGDVGTNVGLTTGFDTAYVTGRVHTIPDASTAQCASDLTTVYNYLNTLPVDIQLLYPAQFGNNLVLTPHTYLLNAATVLTDTVSLNAECDSNAVFVIKINGALSTSTYSIVRLANGTQAKNVFWKIDGAVSINNYSVFCGTMVVNNGALNALNTGVVVNGRALTTGGAVTTVAMTATMPPGCTTGAPSVSKQPTDQTGCIGSPVSFEVSAHGSDLTYQWRKGTVNLTNGGNISGATSAILTIDPVTAAAASPDYNVIVSGSSAPRDTSAGASLVVDTAAAITTGPTDQTGCAGSSVSFQVAASGTGLTYQWRKGSADLINSGNISGVKTARLTISPMTVSDTASGYNVVITGTCQPAATSADASLSLCTATGIAPVDRRANETVTIFPNPFINSLSIAVNNALQMSNYEFRLYNILGTEMMSTAVTRQMTSVETTGLPAGIYFYKVVCNAKIIQSGRLVSVQ